MIDIEKEYIKSNKVSAIWLSNHHKSKLFEMCNNIIENKNPNASIYVQDKTIRIPKQGEKEFGYDDFHWFELCTTHLAFHIMEDPLEYLQYCIKYAMISDKIQMQHPVDFLYEEYNTIRELFLNKYNYKGRFF